MHYNVGFILVQCAHIEGVPSTSKRTFASCDFRNAGAYARQGVISKADSQCARWSSFWHDGSETFAARGCLQPTPHYDDTNRVSKDATRVRQRFSSAVFTRKYGTKSTSTTWNTSAHRRSNNQDLDLTLFQVAIWMLRRVCFNSTTLLLNTFYIWIVHILRLYYLFYLNYLFYFNLDSE